MALFRVTAKQSKNTNGIRVEKGMSVEVVINSVSNPLKTNGGQDVADAFYCLYGMMPRKWLSSQWSIVTYNGLDKA